MNYDYAKDIFNELKNFEGKATFEGSEIVINYFVLLPKEELEDFSLPEFLTLYTSNTSFEIEGNHEAAYTIIAINAALPDYTDDADYLAKLTIW